MYICRTASPDFETNLSTLNVYDSGLRLGTWQDPQEIWTGFNKEGSFFWPHKFSIAALAASSGRDVRVCSLSKSAFQKRHTAVEWAPG
jgi:hypothetical protein